VSSIKAAFEKQLADTHKSLRPAEPLPQRAAAVSLESLLAGGADGLETDTSAGVWRVSQVVDALEKLCQGNAAGPLKPAAPGTQ
jgi:hypothetical protein